MYRYCSQKWSDHFSLESIASIISETSTVISKGFATCPFIPASKAFILSSGKALAVIDRIGIEAFFLSPGTYSAAAMDDSNLFKTFPFKSSCKI